MNLWLNAQLPPKLAKWLTETFGVGAVSLKELDLQGDRDIEIFNAARANGKVSRFSSTERLQIKSLTCNRVVEKLLSLFE